VAWRTEPRRFPLFGAEADAKPILTFGTSGTSGYSAPDAQVSSCSTAIYIQLFADDIVARGACHFRFVAGRSHPCD